MRTFIPRSWSSTPAHRAARGKASRFSFLLHPSAFLLAATTLLVAGCGFQLRGQASLPFHTLYVQAAPTSPFALQLKRAVQSGSSTQLADRADQAEAVLQILAEYQEKEILSLGAGGRVREFQLRYRVQFRLTDDKNREHIPMTELILKRDYSFNDEQVLSKESEELLLYRDMRSDAVNQLVRRLQAAKMQSREVTG